MEIIEALGNSEAIARVGKTMRRKATILGKAGEPRPVTQIFAPRRAIAASPASVPEPGDPDALPTGEIGHGCAERFDHAHDLMARNDRQRAVNVSVSNVQIGPAHAAGTDRDAHLPRAGHRYGAFDHPKWMARGIKLHRLHVARPIRHRGSKGAGVRGDVCSAAAEAPTLRPPQSALMTQSSTSASLASRTALRLATVVKSMVISIPHA